MSARPTLQFSPGMVIDRRYEIKRHLGDGGMGCVYLASQKLLNREVAIKFIPLVVRPGAIDPATLFQQEAELQAKLKHPNIVEALDGGILDKRPEDLEPIGYLVMEYVEGGSLRRSMLERPRDVLFATTVLQQVATGLDTVHAARILHRDLKPENVLVTRELRVKIADLGNARFTGSSKYKTHNPRPVGTLHYMPFEQLMNSGMDEKTDTFSLGVMAFELYAGYHPRARDERGLPTRQEVLGPLLAREPMPKLGPVAPEVPEALAALIDRAMSIEPEARPTAQELERALRDHLRELREDRKRRKAAAAANTSLSAGQAPRVATEPMDPPLIQPPLRLQRTAPMAEPTPQPLTTSGERAPVVTGPILFLLMFLSTAAVCLGVLVFMQRRAQTRAMQASSIADATAETGRSVTVDAAPTTPSDATASRANLASPADAANTPSAQGSPSAPRPVAVGPSAARPLAISPSPTASAPTQTPAAAPSATATEGLLFKPAPR